MIDPTLQRVVLRKLARWRRITASDLHALLNAEERLIFREHMLKDLEAQDLIHIRTIGDEEVLSMSEAGARWLAKHEGP